MSQGVTGVASVCGSQWRGKLGPAISHGGGWRKDGLSPPASSPSLGLLCKTRPLERLRNGGLLRKAEASAPPGTPPAEAMWRHHGDLSVTFVCPGLLRPADGSRSPSGGHHRRLLEHLLHLPLPRAVPPARPADEDHGGVVSPPRRLGAGQPLRELALPAGS